MTTENFDKILKEEKENRLATLAFIKSIEPESTKKEPRRVIDKSKSLRYSMPELCEFFEHSILCDVTFTLDYHKISAHKIILAAASPYFKAMFTANFNETNLKTIDLSGSLKNFYVFRKILYFFYSGQIEIDMENVIPFLTIAKLLVVEEIITECENLLLDFLTVKNSLSMAFLADVFELKELKISTSTVLETLLFSKSLLKQITYLPFEGILWLIQQEVFQSCSNFTVEAVTAWLKKCGDQEDYDIVYHILADSYGIDLSDFSRASELLNNKLLGEILHTSSNETMEEMLVFINLNSISIMFYSPSLNNWFSFPLKCSQDDLFPIGALKSGKMLVRKKTGSQLFAVDIRDQEKPKETISAPKHNNWKNIIYGSCDGKYVCLQRNNHEMRLVKLKEVKSKFFWKPWPGYNMENLPALEGKLLFVGGSLNHVILSERWYDEQNNFMILRKNVYPFNYMKIPNPRCTCSGHKNNGQGSICLSSLSTVNYKVYMNLSQTDFKIILVSNQCENSTVFDFYIYNLLNLEWTFQSEKSMESLRCASGISNLYLIRKHDQVYVTKVMHADHKVILPPLRFERIIHEFRCVMLPKCLLEKAEIDNKLEIGKNEVFNFEWMKLLPY